MTGAPGAGKSTLVQALITQIRGEGHRVAVLAVDPTSPFSGGALLGDRVRMQGHATDGGVFIRSMAARGHLGGLALAAPEAIRILDAAGAAYILVETVGVGQSEVEVMHAADTTVVVVTPRWGDGIQAGKAGLLEIGDVFVVNKADRDGARETVRELNQMIDFGAHLPWRPPVLEAVATAGTGVAQLWSALKAHRAHLETSGELGERRRGGARPRGARCEGRARGDRPGGGSQRTARQAGPVRGLRGTGFAGRNQQPPERSGGGRAANPPWLVGRSEGADHERVILELDGP